MTRTVGPERDRIALVRYVRTAGPDDLAVGKFPPCWGGNSGAAATTAQIAPPTSSRSLGLHDNRPIHIGPITSSPVR
jgi:hypothetical protein